MNHLVDHDCLLSLFAKVLKGAKDSLSDSCSSYQMMLVLEQLLSVKEQGMAMLLMLLMVWFFHYIFVSGQWMHLPPSCNPKN